MNRLPLFAILILLGATSCRRNESTNQLPKPLQKLVDAGCVVNVQNNGNIELILCKGFTKFELLKGVEDIQNLDAGLTSIDLKDIRHWKTLKYLSLKGANVKSFNDLSVFGSLEYLNLNNTKVRDLNFLASIPKLKHLWLGKTPVDSLQQLTNCPDLEFLYLNGCSSLTRLDASFGKLKKLNALYANELAVLDIEQIGRLSSLKRLHLDNCRFKAFVVPEIELEILSLCNCKELRSLTMSMSPSLKDLRVSNTRIQSLEFLKKCPNLESLDISGLSLMNLEFVADTNLRFLYADNFGSSNLIVQRPMPYLFELSLRDSEVENVKLTAPRLRTFLSMNSKISAKHLNELRVSLPENCEFD